MKKVMIGAIIFFLAFIVFGFTVPLISETSNDERVILDHTLLAYSAPMCFDQADFTNNIDEGTIRLAQDIGYEAESSCTLENMSTEKKPLFIVWFTA
ncbi:hypothetical protein [Alkalihalobacillus pseudalcaliphilus]|uniref:hypothetical protein n=1 Tax=Alkalihalobacillus pseudalcaliphilus TaxID=79884 RepID=UPI00064DD632|nr:hypothetical protein [Alkalihalobacillus pseudalcaliphilus]KMK76060.1 hypothetical protein AB990_12575 [Alkalihalobacillus pseudalcaliphilus]